MNHDRHTGQTTPAHLHTKLCRLDRRDVATGAAANDNEVILGRTSEPAGWVKRATGRGHRCMDDERKQETCTSIHQAPHVAARAHTLRDDMMQLECRCQGARAGSDGCHVSACSPPATALPRRAAASPALYPTDSMAKSVSLSR